MDLHRMVATRALLSELRLVCARVSAVITYVYEKEMTTNPNFDGANDDIVLSLESIYEQLSRQIQIVQSMVDEDTAALHPETQRGD
eukprot:Skav200845  [mRNA]  locus=scaffold2131:148338:148595:- [translate_table: standard]